jgi:hypothetical protein
MDEPIQPLPRSIYDKAKAHGIDQIMLFFKGGDDSGYLNVEFAANSDDFDHDFGRKFEAEVEAWAWTVYEYSGAGEGVDYGDNITYDLEKNTVKTQAWYYTKKYDTPENSQLEISESKHEDDE